VFNEKKASKKYKENVVRLSYENGISAAQVAKNLGISKKLIYK
jgi:transposase